MNLQRDFINNDLLNKAKYYTVPMYSTSSVKPIFERVYKKEDLPFEYTQKHTDESGHEYYYPVRPITEPEEIERIEKQMEEWKEFVQEYNKNALKELEEKREKEKNKSVLRKIWELIWK